MLQTDVKKVDFQWKNTLQSYCVNLDSDLDCIIMFSTKDEKLSEILYHKIIDSLIDRIHPKNTYKDFSNALENINSFLHSWKWNDEKVKWVHGIIALYHKKTFLFSSIWKASCYLYNTHRDVIEITDKQEVARDFSFISSGDIAPWEVVILSTLRLLDILSKDDIIDGMSSWNIQRSWENIENILLHEHTGKNVCVISCTREVDIVESPTWNYDKFSYYFLRACDNVLVKKSLGYIYYFKSLLLRQSQKVKQILLGLGFLISAVLLYNIVLGFFYIASNTGDTKDYKQDLLLAQNQIVAASENMNDEDVFSVNISWAEDIIKQLESKELFLSDISLLKDRIGILQKQFNGIQPFIRSPENTIYSFQESEDIVKVLSVENKIYVIHRDAITWPILKWEEAEKFIFEELSSNDYFVDASVLDTDIVLTTHAGKVVTFGKNTRFSYVDVADQPKWEDSPILSTYASNIYMLSDAGNQILRHKKQGQNYDVGISYLKDQDALSTGRILSLAIDGGIYILKMDGSVVKLFRSPEYRLESIVLNKLPKNYNFQSLDGDNLPSIRARANLGFVYMLLDNRILIFKPNTSNHRDVKSLEYLGQIEGKDIVIQDFYVDNDGEIFAAGANGVYKIEFDVNEGQILLK